MFFSQDLSLALTVSIRLSCKVYTEFCSKPLLVFILVYCRCLPTGCICIPKHQHGSARCRLMDQYKITDLCNAAGSCPCACSLVLSPKAHGLLQRSQGSRPGLQDQTPLLSKREVLMSNIHMSGPPRLK